MACPAISSTRTIGDRRDEHVRASDTGLQAVGMPPELCKSGCRSHLTGVGRWIEAKDPADRACRDADPEPAKLALNANTSPAAVLPAEADDELDDLIAERGTPRTSQGSPTLPLATRELPMPAKQGLGRDEETAPPPSWERPAERGEHRSVCGSVADAAMELMLEQANLVAQHHQLDVLVHSCPSAGSQQTEDPARDEVAQTEAHGR